MIYLHKILPFFFLPLGVTSVLIAVGVISRRRRWCLAGLGLLWVCAMPAASDQVMRAVEGRAVRMPAAAMPEADVIVVLSSGRIRAPGDAGVMEWHDPDRVFGGIALFHAGKAPFLFFPNGKMPWDSDAAAVGPLSMEFAQRMGVPRASMATTEKGESGEHGPGGPGHCRTSQEKKRDGFPGKSAAGDLGLSYAAVHPSV